MLTYFTHRKKRKKKTHNTVLMKQNAVYFFNNTFHKPVDRLKIGTKSNNKKATL